MSFFKVGLAAVHYPLERASQILSGRRETQYTRYLEDKKYIIAVGNTDNSSVDMIAFTTSLQKAPNSV
jgi:hypothetical protein